MVQVELDEVRCVFTCELTECSQVEQEAEHVGGGQSADGELQETQSDMFESC